WAQKARTDRPLCCQRCTICRQNCSLLPPRSWLLDMVCSSFGEHYTMPVKNAIRRTDTSVLMHPEPDGIVQFMSFTAGRTYDPDGQAYDPMTPYTLHAEDPKAEARAVRLTEGKDLWRDSAAWFQFENHVEFRPPRNLAWLKEL